MVILFPFFYPNFLSNFCLQFLFFVGNFFLNFFINIPFFIKLKKYLIYMPKTSKRRKNIKEKLERKEGGLSGSILFFLWKHLFVVSNPYPYLLEILFLM